MSSVDNDILALNISSSRDIKALSGSAVAEVVVGVFEDLPPC